MRVTLIMRFFVVSLFVFASSGFAQADIPRVECDDSLEAVKRDEASLREAIHEALLGLLQTKEGSRRLENLESRIEIEYIGPGRVQPIPPADQLPNRSRPQADDPPPPTSVTDWIGVNPRTCNQFRMSMDAATSGIIGRLATRTGFGQASISIDHLPFTFPPWDYVPPEDEQFVSPQPGLHFSQCIDTRMRNATLDFPKSTVTSFSSDAHGTSCTGTLVGPRHIVTAAHCVYLGGTWYQFFLIPGRDGPLWPFGYTHLGSSPGFQWYWVPEQVIGNPSPDYGNGNFDIAVLIIPARLGDVAGWMGVAASSENTLMSSFHKNLGYPGQAAGSPIGYHPSLVTGGLYGDLNQCNLGAFTNYDPYGWARTVSHSCDNTSGHSGGPLYYWAFDPNQQTSAATLSAIISGHPFFAEDFDCPNNPRPYRATRITTEYLNAILWFLSWKP